MESTMEQIRKQFRETDEKTREFADAVIKAKIESSYLSNETIARVIVFSMLPSDAEDISRWMVRITKARYAKKPQED